MVENCKYMVKRIYGKAGEYFNVFRGIIVANEKHYLWIFGMLYKLMLDIYYMSVVSVYWAIDGLVCSPSAINYFASWILYFVGYYLIMRVENYVILVFLQIQWIYTIAPTIVIFGLQYNRSILYISYILLVLVVQTYIGKNVKEKAPISFGNEKLGSYICVGMCVLTAATWMIMAIWNDFAWVKAFDLNYIYEMRSKLVYPPLFGYVVSWTTKAVLPWLFLLGLHGRKMFLILYSMFFQIMFYMILGHKAPMLLMGIIFIVYVISKINILLPGAYLGMLFGLSVGTIGGWIEKGSPVKTSTIFNALLGERALFIPAVTKHQFYDFFSKYPKSFFSDGMIGRLLSQTNLYRNSLGFTVYAYNNNGSLFAEANTGYLADSYAQMGLVGMLLIGLLVVLVVRFIANYSMYIPREILCSIVACFCVSINDGAFFTILLTGGMWVLILMLAIYAKRGHNDGQL